MRLAHRYSCDPRRKLPECSAVRLGQPAVITVKPDSFHWREWLVKSKCMGGKFLAQFVGQRSEIIYNVETLQSREDYCGNPTRCNNDWKRGSDRRLSVRTSALRHQAMCQHR